MQKSTQLVVLGLGAVVALGGVAFFCSRYPERGEAPVVAPIAELATSESEPAPPEVTPTDALPVRELVRPFPLLQALAEREPPPATVPRLDRSRLHVANSRSADEELMDIAAGLRSIFDRSHRVDASPEWYRVVPITSRIVLFPWRYGCELCEPGSWKILEHTATTLLAEMDAESEDWGLSQRVFKWQLLRLAGRGGEATAVLKAYRGTFCGNCNAGPLSDIRRHLAEAVVADGDSSRGLRLLLDQFREDPYVHKQLATDPALLTHTGLLLLELPNSDGASLLQLVVDLHPTWDATPLARAALEQVGALRETTPERIRSVYYDGLEDWGARWAALWCMPELDDDD